MSFQVIASLLVIILVSLFLYSKIFRKKELKVSELERKYFEALNNGDKVAIEKVGTEYFTLKGLSEASIKECLARDLGNA